MICYIEKTNSKSVINPGKDIHFEAIIKKASTETAQPNLKS